MSALLGAGEGEVLEIDADQFRALGEADPKAVEAIGIAAVTRRAQLSQLRDAAQNAVVVEPPATFLSRMKKFLRLT